MEQVEQDQQELEQQQQEQQQAQEAVLADLNTMQQTLHDQGEIRDNLQEAVNHLRVNMATSEERREGLRNHLGHLRQQMAELHDQRQERERRIEQHDERRHQLREQVAENEVIHQTLSEEFNQLSAKAEHIIKQRDALRNENEAERQEAKKLNTEARHLERDRTQREAKLGEIKVRLDGLSERILEDYEIELSEAVQHYERPADLDLPSLRRELTDTEKELSRLGPVNMAAIDELKEVEAREGFLAQQFTDLQDAKEKLDSIIDHINTTSRKMFQKTFKVIRKNFQELFRKLFGGGKADLVLELDADNPDVLEAGLEIIAQPPGKQPKSITLLSGGEKALTAIALLFAVYRTKPSPFCILDEVDAPLDESNTDVYCKMLEEFCEFSQFIVITHNKRTMQYADAIYGVTQHERGVSTKISVKLDEVENADDLVATERGAGPFSD